MNVLFLLQSSNVTDEELYVSILIHGLKEQDINPFVVFAVDGHPGQFSYQEVKDFAIPELCFRAYDFDWTNKLAAKIDELQIDWLVTFTDKFEMRSPVDSKIGSHSIANILSGCHKRPKTLFVGYDLSTEAHNAMTSMRFDKYIAVSANTARHLMADVDPLIVRGCGTVPSGIDVDIREFYGIPNDAFVLGYIGELSSRMNIPLVIETAKHLGCFLLMCGSGEMITEVDKHKHMTKLLPMIPPSRADWYRAISVFIYPSISSGFPIFPLEAVMMDVPVAMSPVSDFYSLFGDSMAFFNPTKGSAPAVDAVNTAKTIDPAKARNIAQKELSRESMLSGFMSVLEG